MAKQITYGDESRQSIASLLLATEATICGVPGDKGEGHAGGMSPGEDMC